MMWSLPLKVNINGEEHSIRNKCDYRVILDVISALNDNELTNEEKMKCSLYIFYENVNKINDFKQAIKEMFRIINLGKEEENEKTNPILMNWQQDFSQIAPPVSRVLGYSVRDENRFTHWYDFIGAYMEIGECCFSNIISIRIKKQKGKKLEKWEREFYQENKKIIDLPLNITSEEIEWLESEW